MQTLFQFKTTSWGPGSPRLVIKGSKKWVLRYISKKQLGPLFGGYVVWKKPKVCHLDMRDGAIGVWGRRNVSRFRRILRERDAEFRVVESEGPKQDPTLWRYYYKDS